MMATHRDRRAALVAEAHDSIARGSQSFAVASRLFDRPTRERAWLLYAWCRAADDMTDGQELGHQGTAAADPGTVQARLEMLTALALESDAPVPPPFAALREVVRETGLPRRFVDDHLAGFALDAAGMQPETEADLLRYCYHVAGAVGCMMAVVMGVDPADRDTLDRACDLGIAFQLANIARDIVADARVGRCYLPREWLAQEAIADTDLADPALRPQLARLAGRLVALARPYRASARIGAGRLAPRSRLAVLAADAIYGAIGQRVAARGPRAWDRRVRVSGAAKLGLLALACGRSLITPADEPRDALWTREE